MAARGTSAWRKEHFGVPCKNTRVVLHFEGGASASVDVKAIDAFLLIADLCKKYNYPVKKEQTGAYNCRPIRGSKSSWSAHAWGLALDLNWHDNPMSNRLITNIPQPLVAEIVGVTTQSGQRVFKWGGDWDNRPETSHSMYDAMHFEIIATPEELATGLSIELEEDDMIREGDEGPDVKFWQHRLKSRGFYNGKVDGEFGPLTAEAVRAAQNEAGLKQSGKIDVSLAFAWAEKKKSGELPDEFNATIKVNK